MRPSLRSIIFAATFLALAVAVQSLRLGQAFTGPAINAILNTAAGLSGALLGATVGLFTPLFALILGQLPAPLAPAVPFIMLANASMVLVFSRLLPVHSALAVVAAAVVKFGVLFGAVRLFLPNLPAAVAIALGWPQLYTALVGGAAAVILVRVLRQAGMKS